MMKYIKLYENDMWLKMDPSEHKIITDQDIKDCFYDLIDNKFKVSVRFFTMSTIRYINGKYYIFSSLTIEKPPTFKLNDIKETLLFAVPYLCEKYGLVTDIYRIASMRGNYIYKDINEFDRRLSGDVYKFNWNFYVPNELDIKN